MAFMQDTPLTQDELIKSHVGLVYSIVKKYSPTRDEDLIQEGCIGLINAARSYDPDRGVKFSTYAYLWVKGCVLAEYKRRKKHAYVSLDKPLAEDTDTTLGDMIPDIVCIEDDCVSQYYVESIFAGMSDTNREILTMVIDRKTQLEISLTLGARQSQITQRIGDIKNRLRRVLA